MIFKHDIVLLFSLITNSRKNMIKPSIMYVYIYIYIQLYIFIYLIIGLIIYVTEQKTISNL